MPAEIDVVDPDGRLVGKSAAVVFKVDGDTLMLCATRSGAARPTEFASTAANNALLLTLKRAKASN